MAADGVTLDDDAGHAALREVVGSGHAYDAATHDHHVATDHSGFPLSRLRVAPMLSERADQVKPVTRVGCARLPVLDLERQLHWRLSCDDGTSSRFSAARRP